MNVKNTDVEKSYRRLNGEINVKRPLFIFEREQGLYDDRMKLFRVDVGIGFSAYCDFVFALTEQDALDILADALDDDAIPQEQPWLAQKKVADEDIDEKLDEDGYYLYLGNASERYDPDGIAITSVPFEVIVEIIEIK